MPGTLSCDATKGTFTGVDTCRGLEVSVRIGPGRGAELAELSLYSLAVPMLVDCSPTDYILFVQLKVCQDTLYFGSSRYFTTRVKYLI